MKYKIKESDILKQIKDLLKLNGIWFFRHQSSMGSYPGVSDLLGIYQGRFLAIELKRPGLSGKPLPDSQQRFIDEVNRNDGKGFVAYSVEDVIRELNFNKVKLF